MERRGVSLCDGFCAQDGIARDAPFERECGWCGMGLDLCERCRASIYICARCHRERARYGPEEAKRRGKRREAKRAYMARWRRRVYRARPGQAMLWPRETVFKIE